MSGSCSRAIALTTLCMALASAAPVLAEEGRVLADEPLDCLIEASATLKIGAAVPGLIRDVLVDRGDVVRKGQRLVELDSEVEEAVLAAAKSKAANDSPIHSGRARLEFLRRKQKRMETLRVNSTVTEASYDEAVTDERVAALALREAELNYDIAQSEMRRAEGMLRQRTVLSPIDGVVVERVLGAGEYRTEQAHVLVLARMNPLYVEVFVPVAFFGQTRLGMTAVVEPEDPVGGSHAAKVIAVDTLFDASSGTYGVRLALPNLNLSLPGGLRCKIRFTPRSERAGPEAAMIGRSR